MRKLLLWIGVLSMLGNFSCSNAGVHTTKVVKPKYHHWRYERKNDKRVKRTKKVKVIS